MIVGRAFPTEPDLSGALPSPPVVRHNLPMVEVVPIPCFEDNYAFLLVDAATGEAAVIDAPEAEPILAAVAKRSLRLTAVLCTHHHWDHIGGNEALAAAFPDLEVIGLASDAARIPALTRALADGETVEVVGLRATCLHTPGHTLGAVCYHVAKEGWLFTGDTLFGGGCGRLFEGSAAQMQTSLARLATLPGDTQVWFAHEYTATNLRFAARVEPDNPALADRYGRVRGQRTAGVVTCPSTVTEERATNPFLRWDEPAVIKAARAHGASDTTPTEVFAAIRRWKETA